MQQYTHENVRSIPHLPIYCDRYEDYRQFSPRHWHAHIEIIYCISLKASAVVAVLEASNEPVAYGDTEITTSFKSEVG